MKLIKASYKIITPINGEEILKNIELAARDCYQSDGKIETGIISSTNEFGQEIDTIFATSARVLIPKLMNAKPTPHEAMLEFGGMIHVRFIVDRGVSHELVRHRMASFAQESTRYCNYGKDEHIQFIIPNWLTIHENTYSRNHSDFLGMTDDANDWCKTMLNLEYIYNTLINSKWTPQQARSVLPNSLKTTINISCNIREWRHIFKLRTAKAAHPQMREVMCPLLDEFKRLIPILFDDINY
jgi:thymidylate synthase (FAD)